MIPERNNQKLPVRQPLKRIVRAVAVLFYVTLGTGMLWLAIDRWNGSPANPDAMPMTGIPPGPPIDPEWDRTEELIAALEAIPQMPTMTLPPAPPGMEWTAAPNARPVNASDALRGAWTPETRPNLQGVIDYLESPAVRSAMDRLAAIEPGGWRPSTVGGVGLLRLVRQATKLFVARARYHHAGFGDVDAAFADLEASYRIAAINYDSGALIGTLVSIACEGLANSELCSMARETALTNSQATRILNSINRILPDRRAIWELAMAGEFDAQNRRLESAYTDDGRGNGWLVLNYLDNVVEFTRSPEPRCGAWNVLSPLFNSRRTVAAKIDTLRRGCDEAGGRSYADALAAIRTAEANARFNMVDGPFCRKSQSSSYARTYAHIIRYGARRRGTIVSVALSAYRHDHGEYPPTLEGLIGDYLEALPLDPFVDHPLHYKREGKDDYVLYSVGENTIDDGGKKGTIDPQTRRLNRDGDLILTRPRAEPYMEPTLQKVRS